MKSISPPIRPRPRPRQLQSIKMKEKPCTLSDAEIIEKVREINTELCRLVNKGCIVRIPPPEPNNCPNVLIEELCSRFEKAITIDEPTPYTPSGYITWKH